MHAMLATVLDPEATEFKVTHLEMIKVRGAANPSAPTSPFPACAMLRASG